MRKAAKKPRDPDLSDHYDFSGAERGKYARRYAEGTTVTVFRSGKPQCMRVSAWKKYGKSETDTECGFGLNLGKQNRQQFFEGLESAEVEMDGVRHSFSLTRKNFWTTCPELRDEDARGTPIRDWLLKYRSLTWKKGFPPKADLISLGEGRFRLVATW
jgi:hypothetical protein